MLKNTVEVDMYDILEGQSTAEILDALTEIIEYWVEKNRTENEKNIKAMDCDYLIGAALRRNLTQSHYELKHFLHGLSNE